MVHSFPTVHNNIKIDRDSDTIGLQEKEKPIFQSFVVSPRQSVLSGTGIYILEKRVI